MRVDLDKLLDKAKDGRLQQHELDQVAVGLRRSDERLETTYSRLHVVGRAYATEYEELVAGFLHRPDDPMLSKLALQILCSWWDLGGKYLTELWDFLAGVEWDEEGQVRLIAISAAGHYIRDHGGDRGLMGKLLEIAESSVEDDVDQSAAVEAIARSLGDEWTSFPGLGGRLPKNEWRSDVLARAHARYSEMGSP